MIKNTLLLFVLFGIFPLFSQEKILPEARIEYQNDSMLLLGDNQCITSKSIQLASPEDVGALTQKIAGITLKNYGGIGGMKTISYRGISGTNTAVLLDGFMLQNNMVGQLDLSNLQVDNLQNLQFASSGVTLDELIPVSALMQGNILSMNTFENKQSNDSLEFLGTSKLGSFGLVDNYAGIKCGRATSLFSVYGKIRRFSGEYQYDILNGTNSSKQIRKNNGLEEGFAGVNYIKYFKEYIKFHTSIHFNQSKRGLPGAVILYNETANQLLNQQNTYWNTELEWKKSKSKIRVYTSLNYGYLNYIDSSYLNNVGGLNNWYYNTVNQTGVSGLCKIKDSTLVLYGGVEYTYSVLNATNQFLFSPKRNHFQSVVGLKYKMDKVNVTLQYGNHVVQNRQQNSSPITSVSTSFLQLEKNEYSTALGLPRVWFKQTFRMPSFSELYYNSFGNKTLKPELTMQFNAGTSYRFFKNSLHVSVDGYYNHVENKILAIPTKNLFVWSIQNIGKVAVYGVDVLIKKIWKLHTNLEVSASMNYSYQKIIDISDVKSSTYKNQLAYFPLHTVQSEISLWMFNKIGLYVSNSNLTNRYVLNENIPTNALQGFSIYDAVLSYRTNRETKNSVKFSFTVKNCFNTPYQYISYFVMPGRNYLITMSYAFN